MLRSDGTKTDSITDEDSFPAAYYTSAFVLSKSEAPRDRCTAAGGAKVSLQPETDLARTLNVQTSTGLGKIPLNVLQRHCRTQTMDAVLHAYTPQNELVQDPRI